MNRAQFDGWCEKGILAIVLGLLIYSPLAFGAVRPLDLPIIVWFTLAASAIWVLRMWLGQNREFYWPPACWLAVVFIAYLVFRYRGAEIEYLARRELIRDVSYVMLFLVIAANLGRQESARVIVWTLLILAVGLTIVAACQYFTGAIKIWGVARPMEYRFRGSGTYVCPNHLAGFLEMVLPLGLAYAFMGRMSHVARILTAYASLMALGGIGLTVSRGGWVAAGLALIFFFFVIVQLREYRITGIIALLVLVLGCAVFIMNADLSHLRFQALFASGKVEDVRFDYYGPAIKIWLDHFWLGGGPGHFSELFRAYRPETVVIPPNFTHNDYLNTLADLGLVGGLIALAGWVVIGLGAFQTWRQLRLSSNELSARPSSRSALVLGAATGLLAILFHAFTDFNFNIPANAIVSLTLAALLTGHLRYASSRFAFKAGFANRIALTVLLLAGALWSAQQAVVRMRENEALDAAGRAPVDSPAMVAALKQAHAADPMDAEITWHLGESCRRRSWALADDYQALATEGLSWFQRTIELNPESAWSYIGAGMCLDWLDRTAEADKYFATGLKLDPNGVYTLARVGWHYAQKDDFVTAEKYLERSLRIWGPGNDFAIGNLIAVRHRMEEQKAKPPGA